MRRRWHIIVQHEDGTLQMGSKSGFAKSETLLKVLNDQQRMYTHRVFAARVVSSDTCGRSSLIVSASHWHELLYEDSQFKLGEDEGEMRNLLVKRKGVALKRKKSRVREKPVQRTAPNGKKRKKKEKRVAVRANHSRR